MSLSLKYYVTLGGVRDLNDLKHGQGKFTFKNGKIVEGMWKNGEFVGNAGK